MMQERILDALWLEPPEPLELTLEAIEKLLPGERLRLLIHRKPQMLFPILQEWGFAYQTIDCADGSYEILIWLKEADPRNPTSDQHESA
jgi:TusA-related sulfurtransferase